MLREKRSIFSLFKRENTPQAEQEQKKPAQKAAPSGEAGAPAGDGGGSAASTTSAAPSD